MNNFLNLILNIYLSGLFLTFVFLFLTRKYVEGDNRIVAILSFRASLMWFITVPKMIYYFIVEIKRLSNEDKNN